MENSNKHPSAKELVKKINDTIDLRNRIRNILFNTHTPTGKLFDIVLMLMIIASIFTIILHSIPSFNKKYHAIIYSLDWFFTVAFFIEYCLRIYSAKERKEYAFGWWGIVDFIAVIPSVFSLWVTGYQTIQVIRIVRLLRVFKVLRLFKFISEGYILAQAMKASFHKIAVFMSFIFVLVVLLGSLMYVVEDGNPGFESIPSSIYWGIVTITTVGFGDIVPLTMFGKLISSIIMLAGYAIIAVPTGIMTGEVVKANIKHQIKCFECGHLNDYSNKFCSECGDSLLEEKTCE